MMKVCLKMRHAAIACLAVGVIGALGLHAQTKQWPLIRPVHKVFTVIFPATVNWDAPWKTPWDAPFVTYVQDIKGVPVYKFECHSGTYDDDSEWDFSGAYQCVMFAIKPDGSLTSSDLLAANTEDELSTDWWNRGRMRAAQLRGKCLAYPEYSTLRHFRLRGMLITISFTDLAWGPVKGQDGAPLLTRFRFTLDVAPDKAARSSRAQIPLGPRPPTSCYP